MPGHPASRFLDRIDTVIDFFAGLSLMMITAIVFLNALGRYLFSFNILGAEEGARLLMVYLCFLGTYTLLRRGGHVSVDIVMLMASARVQRVMRGLIGLLVVLVMGFLAYTAWQLVIFSAGTGQRSTTLPVPRYFFFLPAALGATLATLSGLETLFQAFTNRLPPLPDVLAPEVVAGATPAPVADKEI
ncbi:TRAP transporter small permease [Oceaniglobus ichthyenteri]|uniref:TRAP transporter small permease n=1 Tax=Oceaniglobus ichthyenteri TaxID=2136177 RepID=UPI000D388CC6|nr:TRAP transporter small permease [Oceaniglobus ichthyenteri]